MSNIQEIKKALSIIAFGYLNKNKSFYKLTSPIINKAFKSAKGQKILKKQDYFITLHYRISCTK